MSLVPDPARTGMRLVSESGTVRASILGVNAWLVTVLWPLASSGNPRDTMPYAIACTSLALLVAGLVALRARRRGLGAWLSLCAFPASVIAATAWRSGSSPASSDPLVLTLQALSLLAYGAAVAPSAEAAPVASSRHVALEADALDMDPVRTRRTRAVFTLLVCIGTFLLAVLAPILGDPGAFQHEWGDATREGRVLIAVVGASTAVATVTGFAGALRADPDDAVAPRDRWLRVGSLLLLALLGAATWFAIQP